MSNKPEAEFDLMGLSDRAIKALMINSFTSKESILVFMGKNPRKLLKLKGVGDSVYLEILTALDDIRLERAENRYQVHKKAKSKYEKRHEEALASQIEDAGLQGALEQYKFHSSRKWALDFAFPDVKLGIEVDGGTHMKGKGGHNSGKGYEEDRLKDQAALLLGWAVYRVTPRMIISGDAITTIIKLLESRLK